MLRTEVPIPHILPIEDRVRLDGVVAYFEAYETGAPVYDALAVPLVPDQPEGLQILVDGHHRGRAAHEAGRLALPTSVFEADAEFGPWVAEYHPSWNVDSLDGLRLRYRRYWAPRLQTGMRLERLRVMAPQAPHGQRRPTPKDTPRN